MSFPPSWDAELAPRVRDVLAGDSTYLVPFFSASNILARESDEAVLPFGPFQVVVVPVSGGEQGGLGGEIEAKPKVNIYVFLPRQGDAPDPSITVPAAPAVTAAAGPGLTGVWRWSWTRVRASGESYASPLSAPVTLADQKASVPLPPVLTGDLGFRLWRTPAGLTSARYAQPVLAAFAGPWVDDLPDTRLGHELYPRRGLTMDLYRRIAAVLESDRILQAGNPAGVADDVVTVERSPENVSDARNQRVMRVAVSYSVIFDAESGASESGG